MDFIPKRHLPRLGREFYRGSAFVHWTANSADRTTGWLSAEFHSRWQLILLHTCSRYGLSCPAYTLMPDHFHMLWLGLDQHGSDQRVAIAFFMKHTRALRGQAAWQRQPYEQVLREHQRERNAFANVAGYILENPVRAGLVERHRDWPYSGCCVSGYPDLDVHSEEFWPLFWRLYERQTAH